MVAFQLIDADYFLNGTKPVIRLFGRTENDKSICLFVDNFLPYFYVKGSMEKISQIKDIVQIEEVEKFTPEGYTEKPSKFLKLTVANPQKLTEIRDRILSEGLAEGVYEADILFKYRYMVDMCIKGMEWVEAECRPITTSLVKIPAYQAISVKPMKKMENSTLRYFCFDIETLYDDPNKPMDAKNGKIVMISVTFYPDFKGQKSIVLVAKPTSEKNTKGCVGEKEMLEEFLKIIEVYDPDIITGYNINSFDMPFLLGRLKENKLPNTLGRAKDKQAFCRTAGLYQETTVPGRVVVDPYIILKRDPWMKFYRYTLNNVAKILLNDEKVDINYKEMPKLWNGSQEDLKKFVEYCRKDSELSIRLVVEKGLIDKFFEISKISGVLLQDSLGGQSQRIEIMLLHEMKKKNYIMLSRPSKKDLSIRGTEREKEGLKGATVLEPVKGLHSDGCIIVLDFKSLYPSLMRTYNISPDTLIVGDAQGLKYHQSPSGAKFIDASIKQGILPEILSGLVDARSNTKKLMKTSSGDKKRILNAKQLAIKDMSNSIYGYVGYIRARLYMIDVASSVTSFGRSNIEFTKSLVEKTFPDVSLVYGDTDSIFVKTKTTNLDEAMKTGEEISKFVTDNLPGYLELQFEKIYRTFLILTKKRYAGWRFDYNNDKWSDTIEMKGIETVRRDWCPLVSDTMKEVINTLLKEGDLKKSINIVKDTVEKLKKNEVLIEKLTVVKGITKAPSTYNGKLPHIELARKLASRNPHDPPKVGDRLGYVIIKGNMLLSKRAEDPAYIKENKIEIDSEYYIHSQLLPPIERIFSSVGIEKSELLGGGRQINFFDFVSGKKREMERKIELTFDKTLDGVESFVCDKCSRDFDRISLTGLCDCGGKILMSYHGSTGSKMKMVAK